MRSAAATVAVLLALDPVGFGGVCVRAGPGPARDAFLGLLRNGLAADSPILKLPASVDEDRLTGGLDLAATLATGRAAALRGLLADADKGLVSVTMAERLSLGHAARIAAVMDAGFVHSHGTVSQGPQVCAFGLVLWDEGQGDDPRPPAILLERCAFALLEADLREIIAGQADAAKPRGSAVPAVPGGMLELICGTAMAFGVESARPTIWALRAARLLAWIQGRPEVTLDDVEIAVALVLAPRATRLPAGAEAAEDDGTQDDPGPQEEGGPQHEEDPLNPGDARTSSGSPPAEVLIEAVTAALPAEVLAALGAEGSSARSGTARDGQGSGDAQHSARRGRPAGSRRGALTLGRRLDLIATLRVAAPWQRLRRAAAGVAAPRVIVTRDDLRIRRFVKRRQACTIFVVDASGSSAFQRMAEAKGAIELMLARAYVARARVALIAFRDVAATLVVPPTRSLTRARRLLGDMVGGGGTPLAAGLEAALVTALAERARGVTPRIVLLTDGRANITRDGKADRPIAMKEAEDVARRIAAAGFMAVHIDTAAIHRPGGDTLARAMRGLYAALPKASGGASLAIARLAGSFD
jgi:magnesium chelatase subunit D